MGGETPQGMKKTKHTHVKEILVAFIPKKNVRRVFSELFNTEEEYDAWWLMNQNQVLKIIEIKVKEVFTEYYSPEEEVEE
jgi:hypothetical protein